MITLRRFYFFERPLSSQVASKVIQVGSLPPSGAPNPDADDNQNMFSNIDILSPNVHEFSKKLEKMVIFSHTGRKIGQKRSCFSRGGKDYLLESNMLISGGRSGPLLTLLDQKLHGGLHQGIQVGTYEAHAGQSFRQENGQNKAGTGIVNQPGRQRR